MIISVLGGISIVINSDREFCYEHLKKINLRWKLSMWHELECLCVQKFFELPEMAKNEVLDFSGPTCMNQGSSIFCM